MSSSDEWRAWARGAPPSALQAFVRDRKTPSGLLEPHHEALDIILDELVRRINNNQEDHRASHQP